MMLQAAIPGFPTSIVCIGVSTPLKVKNTIPLSCQAPLQIALPNHVKIATSHRTPWKKPHLSLPAAPLYKLTSCQTPLFENLVGGPIKRVVHTMKNDDVSKILNCEKHKEPTDRGLKVNQLWCVLLFDKTVMPNIKCMLWCLCEKKAIHGGSETDHLYWVSKDVNINSL